MVNILNSIFNTLVRDVNPTVKVFICIGFFLLAAISLFYSIRKKNDKAPIAWGWMVLFIVSLALAVVYAIF